jgi:LysM repeat protein
MSNRPATVIPADGLRLRAGPGTDADILGLLAEGMAVTITARSGEWRRVETALGPGFVHGDFITVDGQRTVNEEPPGLDPEIPEADRRPPDDRTGAPAPAQFYTVVPGDSLGVIGARLGVDWREIAAANGIGEPFTIHVNQVLRIPGTAVRAASGVLAVRNPLGFAGQTLVTSSSAQGHHTPYGGTRSCDLDIIGASTPGTAVNFDVVAPAGVEVRGVVNIIGPACRSGDLADGGQKVQLNIQRRDGGSGDAWQNTGAWVLYAHLDPVLVSVDEPVAPGARLGLLGPPAGPEYNSSCAQGSHVHVEAARGSWVVDVDTQVGRDTVIEVTI